MKLFLVFGTAAVVVFFTTSQVTLHRPFSCHFRLMPIRCEHAAAGSNVAAVKDVRKVIDAAYRDRLDETLVHLYATVSHAQTAGKGTSKWAFEIDQAAFCDTNPIPMEYMMKRLGIIPTNEHRLANVPALPDLEKRLVGVPQRTGLL